MQNSVYFSKIFIFVLDNFIYLKYKFYFTRSLISKCRSTAVVRGGGRGVVRRGGRGVWRGVGRGEGGSRG